MQTLRTFVLGLVALGLLASTGAFAGGMHEKSAMHEMAEIMHRLKHYPSPQGKESLEMIVQSSKATKNERTIAQAMMNLQHKVASSDVPKLKAIINDKNATANERELAGIVLNLDHRPSKDAKAKLKMMMQH